MNSNVKISLAIPTYNRFDLLLECFAQVIDDPRIDEIVISDDASNDGSWEKLSKWDSGCNSWTLKPGLELSNEAWGKIQFWTLKPGLELSNEAWGKIQLFRNEKNLDCYRNKREAVVRCSNDWVVLFDDDNVITPAYLDALYNISRWYSHVAYLPEFAKPNFDYREFSKGVLFDSSNVAKYLNRKSFTTLLNTANYFFHRDTWLACWDGSVDPHTADSIYQNYNWLKAGNSLYVVPGLQYFHRVHDGSHYKRENHKTGNFAQQVENKLKALR